MPRDPAHVVAVAFIAWLRWDSAAACSEREAKVRSALATSLKVAAFAEGVRGDFTASQGSLRFDAVRQRTHCLFANRAITGRRTSLEAIPSRQTLPVAFQDSTVSVWRCM